MKSSSKISIYAALTGNFLVTATKFTAAIISGSSAMLSEGIHSLVDTGNQFLLLFGLRQSKKPATDLFPYGHGKEVYFWSFVVAILIFALGAGVSVYEGINHLITPNPIEDPLINYIVLSFAFIFEGTTLLIALKQFSKEKGKYSYFEAVHRGKDPSHFIVIFEDSAAVAGIVTAFAGIFLGKITGNPYFDGIASIIIGIILGITAALLAYETKGLLIGESANKEIVSKIRKIISSFDEIQNINEILTMHMGPDYILANIAVDFIGSIGSEEVEYIISLLDKKIKNEIPDVKRIFIEAESFSKNKRSEM
ncbi:MAG: cation diffusion facilitator family transporter [Ignavibacteriaceae bacterium]